MNQYDICCMNKMINGKQCTVVWYVNDIKASHVDANVLTSLIDSMQIKYGKQAPLTMTRGKVHEYLGMTISLSWKGKVMISIINYILKIFSLLPEMIQRDIQI